MVQTCSFAQAKEVLPNVAFLYFSILSSLNKMFFAALQKISWDFTIGLVGLNRQEMWAHHFVFRQLSLGVNGYSLLRVRAMMNNGVTLKRTIRKREEKLGKIGLVTWQILVTYGTFLLNKSSFF